MRTQKVRTLTLTKMSPRKRKQSPPLLVSPPQSTLLLPCILLHPFISLSPSKTFPTVPKPNKKRKVSKPADSGSEEEEAQFEDSDPEGSLPPSDEEEASEKETSNGKKKTIKKSASAAIEKSRKVSSTTAKESVPVVDDDDDEDD